MRRYGYFTLACLSAMLALTSIGAPSAFAAKKERGGFAAVRADGVLAYGKGVKKAVRFSTGYYFVFFSRSIAGCAYFIQIGNPEPSGGGNSTLSTLAIRNSENKRKLQVYVTHANTGDEDHGFFVQAVC